MTWSGKSAARGGVLSSSLLLFIAILASLTNVLFVLSLPVNNDSDLEQNAISIDVMTVKTLQFQCKPQDRSYSLTDLMRHTGQLNESEEINVPSYIVVKRCDSHAGCCSNYDKVCTVTEGSTYLEVAEVQLEQVTRTERKVIMKRIEIEHHRKCKCKTVEYLGDRQAIDARMPNVTFVATPQKKRIN